VNTAARLFLAFGSSALLLGCSPSGTGGSNHPPVSLKYRDHTLPDERHAAISQALLDLADGGIGERMKAEEYLTIIGQALGGRITPYVAQLLSHNKSEVRDAATRIIITTAGADAVPYLIDFLNSPNPMIRRDAAVKIRLVTGREFGYEYDAPEDERRAAVEKWKEWWRAVSAGGGIGRRPSRGE